MGNTFVFASEIKALLAYPGVRRELDLEALHEIFTFWHTLPPRTAFRDIRELPPGHSAIVAGGRVTMRPYWDLNYSQDGETGAGTAAREQECSEDRTEGSHELRDGEAPFSTWVRGSASPYGPIPQIPNRGRGWGPGFSDRRA